MANLVLTERCNKGCSYCFAKGSHEGREDMTFEQAKMIIDTLWDKEVIKLLGGEPTIAKHFKEILDYIIYKQQINFSTTESDACSQEKDFQRCLTIISNMLFDEDTLIFLEEYFHYGADIAFLANATELDEYNRAEIFKRNVSRLISAADSSNIITLSITVAKNKSVEYHKNYIKWLTGLLPEIKRYRLSAPFPDGDTQVNPIGDLETGEKIYEIFKFLIEEGFIAHLDCVVLPCMFTPEQYGYIRSFSNTRSICHAREGAFDIYPDGHCIRCYPSSYIRTEPTNDPEQIFHARDIIFDISKQLENPFKKECENCNFYKLNLCKGPCRGYFTNKNMVSAIIEGKEN